MRVGEREREEKRKRKAVSLSFHLRIKGLFISQNLYATLIIDFGLHHTAGLLSYMNLTLLQNAKYFIGS